MGTVYLCEHEVLHRRLAVKVLRPDLTSDPELVDRFRNEAIAASRIGQENVVDVLDFGAEEDGALYYVMEALEGRSLGAVIRETGALDVPRALDLLEQICRALAAAHARGVVHRDVKPDNVFLVRREDGSERAKVIDFGISHVPRPKGAAPITRVGSIIGTPEYMAPEQAAGEPVDLRTDVYAVGVLAFEMLTGELPIEAATPIATLVAHRTDTPDPPSRRRPTIPAEVDVLVLRALAKKPEDRFESMDALAAEVARLRARLGSRTVSYSPPRASRPRAETVALPEAEAARNTMRRRRRMGAVVAAFVIAAAIAMAGWLAAEWVREGRAGTGTSVAVPTATSAPAATPTSAPTSTSAPSPTSTANPTATPIRAPASAKAHPATPSALPDTAVQAPVLLGEGPSAPAPPPLLPADPARAKKRPAAHEEPPKDALKDPYPAERDLKDPFR
jgi:serine/threonine-protein kinase